MVIKPNWKEQIIWLQTLRKLKRPFKLLHLGDEHSSDPIEMYNWPEISGILRIYGRNDIPQEIMNKVLTIPLGYHRQFRGNRMTPLQNTPQLPFRDNIWSFYGTNWKDRSKQLKPLESLYPHIVKYFDEWNDSNQLNEEDYISLLLNTKFVPCPQGNNVETYRFYEALDCGCIPIFIHSDKTDLWIQSFYKDIPLLKVNNWNNALEIMQHFIKNPEQMENYRNIILLSWSKFKVTLQDKIKVWLQ